MKQLIPLALMVVLGTGLIGCDSRNAKDLNRIPIPALVPDSFNPVETLDRVAGGGASTLEPARSGFSQITMRTGQVLIAGGSSGGGALRSTVIYDQRSAEFTPTGPMTEGRRGHTATLSRAGDVVVLGGIGADGEPRMSGEIYRSSVGTWEKIQGMAIPRFGHTATLLSTGDILVVGGITSSAGTVTDSCQILDTATLLFADAPPAWLPRAFHSATAIPRLAVPLLQPEEAPCVDGNTENVVVIVGGLTGAPDAPASMIAMDMDIFFPGETSDPWRRLTLLTGSTAAYRWGHQAHLVGCEPDVTMVLLGGIDAFLPPLGPRTLEDSPTPRYDFATLRIDLSSLQPHRLPQGEFTGEACAGDPLACPPFVGGAGAGSVVHGKKGLILYLGGHTVSPYSRDAFVIDPVGLVAQPSMSRMSVDRSFFGISLLPGPDQALGTDDDTALICGGEDSPTTEVPFGEEYAFP